MLRDNAIKEETGWVSRGKGVLVGERRAAVMGGMDETTTMNDTESKKKKSRGQCCVYNPIRWKAAGGFWIIGSTDLAPADVAESHLPSRSVSAPAALFPC